MNFNCYESQIWLRCSLTSIIDSTSTKWSRNNNSNDSVDIAFMNSHKKSITSKNSVTSLDFVSQRWTFGSCPLLKRVRQSDMFFQAAFPLIDALVGWYDGVARREHVELHEVRRGLQLNRRFRVGGSHWRLNLCQTDRTKQTTEAKQTLTSVDYGDRWDGAQPLP